MLDTERSESSGASRMFNDKALWWFYKGEIARGRRPTVPEYGFSEYMGHMHCADNPNGDAPFDLHPEDYDGIGFDEFFARFDTNGLTDDESLWEQNRGEAPGC